MTQAQSSPSQSASNLTQTTQPAASTQSVTTAVDQPNKPMNVLTSFLPLLPSLLWFVFVVVLVYVYHKTIAQLLKDFMWRLRSGAAIKIASVELGPIPIASKQEVSQGDKYISSRQDKDEMRKNERHSYRAQARDIMLVHKLYRSREVGQLYDLIIYVVPHKQASLSGVTRVEYFLGKYWSNMVFPSLDRSRGFPIRTAAYGPLLCTAEVFFNDDTSVILHRYLDFEMGDSAPALLEG
jgi:hypothetical protein